MFVEAPGSTRSRSTSTNGLQKSIPYSYLTLDDLFSFVSLPHFLIWSLPSHFFSLPQVAVISNWLEGTIIQTHRWCAEEQRSLLSLSLLQFCRDTRHQWDIRSLWPNFISPPLDPSHQSRLFATLLKANSGFLLRNGQQYLRSPSVLKDRLRGPDDLMCEMAISIW